MPARRTRGTARSRSTSAISSGSGCPGRAPCRGTCRAAAPGRAAAARARWRPSSSDERSAQCRSSMTSSSGRCARAGATRRVTATKSRRRSVSGSPASGGAPAGRRSRSSGTSRASSAASPPSSRRELRVAHARRGAGAACRPRAVGEDLLLVAAPVEDVEAVEAGGQLGDEPRLADAAVAGHEHERRSRPRPPASACSRSRASAASRPDPGAAAPARAGRAAASAWPGAARAVARRRRAGSARSSVLVQREQLAARARCRARRAGSARNSSKATSASATLPRAAQRPRAARRAPTRGTAPPRPRAGRPARPRQLAARRAARRPARPSRAARRAAPRARARNGSSQRASSPGSSPRSAIASAVPRGAPSSPRASPAPSAARPARAPRARPRSRSRRRPGSAAASSRAALEPARPERPPQPRQRRPQQRVAARRRALLRPQRLDQLVAAHGPLAVQGQEREQQPALAPGQRVLEPLAVPLDLAGGRRGAPGPPSPHPTRAQRSSIRPVLRDPEPVEQHVVGAPRAAHPHRTGRGGLCVPSSRWSSRRAALPIALTMRPPAPITIPFWDSVSTHSSALTRIRSPRCSISSTWTSTLCGTSWRVRASTCSRTSSAREHRLRLIGDLARAGSRTGPRGAAWPGGRRARASRPPVRAETGNTSAPSTRSAAAASATTVRGWFVRSTLLTASTTGTFAAASASAIQRSPPPPTPWSALTTNSAASASPSSCSTRRCLRRGQLVARRWTPGQSVEDNPHASLGMATPRSPPALYSLSDTITTLRPTIALTSVDLPTFSGRRARRSPSGRRGRALLRLQRQHLALSASSSMPTRCSTPSITASIEVLGVGPAVGDVASRPPATTSTAPSTGNERTSVGPPCRGARRERRILPGRDELDGDVAVLDARGRGGARARRRTRSAGRASPRTSTSARSIEWGGKEGSSLEVRGGRKRRGNSRRAARLARKRRCGRAQLRRLPRRMLVVGGDDPLHELWRTTSRPEADERDPVDVARIRRDDQPRALLRAGPPA